MARATISGTPTAAGTYNFTAQAQNAYGADEQTYTVTIAAGVYTWKKYSIISDYVKDQWRLKGYQDDSRIWAYYKNEECPFTAARGFYNEGESLSYIGTEGTPITSLYYIAANISATQNKQTRYGPWDYSTYHGAWSWEVYEQKATKTDTKGAYIADVTSADRNAYPDDGIANGYWYVYAGTL